MRTAEQELEFQKARAKLGGELARAESGLQILCLLAAMTSATDGSDKDRSVLLMESAMDSFKRGFDLLRELSGEKR